MLSACSNKPDERDTLAIQGLLSGALSSQGNYALIGSIQHGGSLWQTSPLERKYNWNHQANTLTSITEVALSGDATKAATASKNQYVLWNIQTGLGEQFWRTGSKILSLALNEQGSRALVGQESGQIWYMDTRTGRNLAEFAHSAEVRSVDLTRTHAVTAGDDFLVRLWELESKALVREKKLKNMARYALFSPSERMIFVSSLRGDHLVLDSASLDIIGNINERYMNVTAATFSPDEKLIYLANPQGTIRAYETLTGSEVNDWTSPPKKAFAHGTSKAVLGLSAIGNQLQALTSGGELHTFNLN
jgi:WD40 repeat protein